MKIAEVVLHQCCRAHKQAWMLMDRGHTVHFVTERPLHIHGWRDYHSCNLVWTGHLDGYQPDISQFASTIETLADSVDLFHVHNEPDWIVKVVKDSAKGKPVVWDVHDMVSQRSGSPDQHELNAMESADGIVVPSRRYKEILQTRTQKPIVEVLSSVPLKLYPTVRRKPEQIGLVYEGGLKGKEQEKSEQFQFRNWSDVFRQITQMNIQVWAYPSSSIENFENYQSTGAMIMPPMRYDQLIKNLSAHECGLLGSPTPNNGAFDGSLPNKMFEYIAAGIPAVAYNAPDAANFLEATGFGVGITDLEQLPEVLDRFYQEETKQYVWDMRKHWAAETQVTKLETLYHQLLGHPRHQAFAPVEECLPVPPI